DARTDIFAFGVLAWELATGSHPFGTDPATMVARMTELGDGRPVRVPAVPLSPELDRIVTRCLRLSPADRYRSGAELLAGVEAVHVPAPNRPSANAPSGEGLWWWHFHQAAIAALNACMPLAAWFARRTIPTHGSW